MFAAFTRMRKLEEATNGKDEPAPMYLLDEIVQEAQSGMQEVGLIVEFCQKRLTAKPPIVKQKTLRLIKHLCSKGATDFRRSMARHSSCVRELTHYRGEPDPLKGDVPNQKVRDAAREALDALFGAENGYSPAAPPAPQLGSRIQGFGSTNYSSNMGGSGGGGSSRSEGGVSGMLESGFAMGQSALNKAAGAVSNRMQGFGNPRFEVGHSQAPDYAPPGSASSNGRVASPRWGSAITGAAGNAVAGASSAISGALSPTARRGHGSAPMLSEGAAADYDSDDASNYARPSSTLAGDITYSERGVSGGSAGGDAADVVDRLCTSGGVRVAPGNEELRTFIESIATLDGLQVGQLLADKMEGASWQAALRALYAVEAILSQGSSAACGEAAVFFQSNPQPLRTAAASPQATVRARARRVLAAIGDETLPDPTTSSGGGVAQTAAAQQSVAAEPDLMGDLLGPDEEAQQQQQQQQEAAAPQFAVALAAPAAGGDLLELLGGPSAPAKVQNQPAALPAPATPQGGDGGMFAGLDLAAGGASMAGDQAPPSVAAPQPSPDDLFGGMSIAGSSGAAQQQPQAHTRASADELADLFTSLAPPGSSAGNAPQASLAQPGCLSLQPQQQLGQSSSGTQQPLFGLAAVQLPQTPPQLAKAHGGSGGHLRSGSGNAFEGLDTDLRRNNKPMGDSLHRRNSSNLSGVGPPAYGAAATPPAASAYGVGVGHMGMTNGVPGMAPQQQQFMQQLAWQQQPQMGQLPFQNQVPYQQPMFNPLQSQQPLTSQAQQPQQQFGLPPLQPQHSTGFSGSSHGRSHSSGVVGGSPTAAQARDTLQQAGLPAGFTSRPEQQEAAFDFIGAHISNLKG